MGLRGSGLGTGAEGWDPEPGVGAKSEILRFRESGKTSEYLQIRFYFSLLLIPRNSKMKKVGVPSSASKSPNYQC